jgi:hypothetical protein
MIASAWLEFGTRYERQSRPDRASRGRRQLRSISQLSRSANLSKLAYRELMSMLRPDALNWYARLFLIEAVGCGAWEDESTMAAALDEIRRRIRDRATRSAALEKLIATLHEPLLDKTWGVDVGGSSTSDLPAQTLIFSMANVYKEFTGRTPTHFNEPKRAPSETPSIAQRLKPKSETVREPAPFTALMREIGASVQPPISHAKIDRLIRQLLPKRDGAPRKRKPSSNKRKSIK